MGFGSLGFSELLVIFVIVLVFFGPRRFPEVARSLGSAMREFRRSLNQIQRELEDADPRKDIPGRELLDEIRSAKAGNWLDPNRTRTPEAAPASVQQTREAAGTGSGETSSAAGGTAGAAPGEAAEPGSPGVDGDEQLPIFEGEEPAEARPEADPTEDSRSG
jgi:sec-independent protein translocase protein TatA